MTIAALFKAYDIRGDAQLLTKIMPNLALVIGQMMQKAGARSVVLGQDGRLTSPKLASDAQEALRALGLEVLHIGKVTTPMLYFAARRYAGGMGLMITASHNPPGDNGCKMMVAGHYLTPEQIAALEGNLQTAPRPLATAVGQVVRCDIQAAYQAALLAAAMPAERALRIVVDAGHGVAGRYAVPILQAAGHEVIGIYCDIDGRFPVHQPDPSRAENLVDLQNSVHQHQADIGLAFDGDGDRVGVVTADGTIISPESILMLLSAAALKQQPGSSVVFDVKTAPQVIAWIRQHHGKVVMSATGHSLMKTTMRKHQAILGGEMSGHFFFGAEFAGDDDALLAALKMVALVAADVKCAPWRHLPVMVVTHEWTIALPNRSLADEVVAAFYQQASLQNIGKITTIDGIRIDKAQSFGLIRPSNTTPVLTLRFGGDSKKACTQMVAAFSRILVAIGQPALDVEMMKFI